MYKSKELLKYLGRMYGKSNKFLIPLIALLLYQGISFTVSPLGVVESFTLSGVCVFYLMVWAGWGYNEADSEVMEKILVLRVRSERRYYWIKLLLLFAIGATAALVAVLMPVYCHLVNHSSLFNRVLTFQDIAAAFWLILLCAYAGGITGACLHPRVLRNRNMAALLVCLYAILGVLKKPVFQEFSFMKGMDYLLPPVSNMMDRFVNADYFTSGNMPGISIWLLVYAVVLSVMQVEILVRRKF